MKDVLPSSAATGTGPGSESGRKREFLLRMLAQDLLEPSQRPVAPRAAGCDEIPASYAQEGLWFVDRINPGTIAFNFPVQALRLSGRLDAAALGRALDEVVRRHEALRTTIVTRDGQPFQVVAPELHIPLPLADLCSLAADERELELKRLAVQAMEAPFDLARGPLLRANLLRFDAQTHVLLMAVHHAVFDVGSMGIFLDELAKLYGAFRDGRESPLAPLTLQYGDYALWEREWMESGALGRQLAYWKEKLAGAQELRLPVDRRRPAVPAGRAMRETMILPREVGEALKELGRREGVTPYVLLLAAYCVLLGRFAGQDDVVIGSPVTTRQRPELAGLIGLFVNMVAIRADLSGRPTFRELLRRMRETALGALDHGDTPFDLVVRELGMARGTNRNPLFQATFAFEPAPPQLGFADLGVERLRYESMTQQAMGEPAGGARAFKIDLDDCLTRFDIEAYVRESEDGVAIEFQGSRELFARETVRSLVRSFRALLQGIVARPDAPVAELPLLDAPERRLIVEERNRTAREYPRDRSVSDVYEDEARKRPDAPAVECGRETVTYAALDARANRVAAALRRLGVAPGAAVGLSLPRSANLIVGMLGILKAGGAYLPLDPEYPAERLQLMLDDTAAEVIVTDNATLPRLAATRARLLPIEGLADGPPADAATVASPARPDGPAYVIFTSGSTGVPKGVQVTHRGVTRLVCNTDYAELGADARIAQASTPSFDAATFEVWAPLLNGGCLVIVPRDVALGAHELARFLRERRLTHLFLTTALFNQVSRDAPDAFATLRQLIIGGEAASLDPIRRVLEAGAPPRFNNMYGPTEVAAFALTHRIESIDEAATTVPIGRPIANTTAYVLDERGEPVPVGMAGELYLGGDGVALGYVNREELTREKFVPDPFGPDPAARLYRTGDWVRYGPGGVIEFIGRRDGQVKVRGYRIELGEIESVLKRQPNLLESLVMAREDEPGEQRIVAYVVPRGDAQPPVRVDDLRAVLREHLPEYMLPGAFVVLDRLPITPNGKIDRDALPPPGASRGEENCAPRSELEERIAALWREMLKLDTVGIDDNFFDVGGHSLLLVRMHARLREALGVECRMVDLFAYPTIQSLARFLQGEAAAHAVAREAGARAARRAKAPGAAEPIAIIGMAGRFPDAPDIEAFWQNLREGRESIRFFTPAEMVEAGVPEAAIADPKYIGARGYLEDADKFDAGFFGYSAREAQIMDPQQRVLLECASEALDRAGYDPDRYAGAIGVFAGSTMSTYLASLDAQHAVPESVGGLSRLLASAQDFLTTRVSYKLNLRGPSVNVQTACSTSLVAIHQACRSLLDFDCDMALAGGVSVTVPLKAGYMYMDEGIGSPDGHCRPFDASAAGTVGGNGVALVLLKRLSEALADGDHIHAVIRGTAINNDGSGKVGYTAPSVEGQSQAIAFAQAVAQCEPGSIDYVEAHGTGTHLGDPIEISALRRVFGAPRSDGPCWIGAVKSNIGHLDAAAGVSGLIKAALTVEHGEIVPSLHFTQPNPQIDFADSPFEVNTRLRPWQARDGRPRRAGVSSFGLGGTNAHAVLEQAPAGTPSGPGREWQLLCLSAKTPAALGRMGANLAHHLRAHPQLSLADVAYTLQVGRRELAQRRVLVARTPEEAAAALESHATDPSSTASCASGHRAPVFMFSGQGSQHPRMALGLYRAEPVFRGIVDECCEKLRPILGLDLREFLFPADAALEAAARRLEDTALAQPALFVVEYAAAKTWIAWGVKPAAMIGHSIGEYVAACVAGVIAPDDALRLVAERGRLMSLQPPGAMTAVGMPEAEVAALLGTQLSLAAVNAPELCVVAGPFAAIERLEADLEARGAMPRRLHTSHAFHSSMMDPALEPFRAAIAGVALEAPRIPYISNMTGDWITGAQATDPAYYVAHLRGTVRFSQGLERLFADADRVFLEVGPGQTLASLARRHPERGAHACIASMRHPADAKDDAAAWLEAAGRLWLAGARPDWSALHGDERRLRVLLPAYPFERTRYWLDAPRTAHVDTEEPLRRIADPQKWLYVPSWKRSAPPPLDARPRASSWLVFCDPHGVGARLAAELEASGSAVATVTPGTAYAALGPHSYVVGPDAPADYERLVAALRAASFVPDGIAHLGVVGPDEEVTDDAAFALACRDRGFYSVAFLLQAMANAGLDKDVKVAVVTSHAVEVDSRDVVCPDKAMAMAPCAVVGMEHPNIRARAIDLQVGTDTAAAARLLARELASPSDAPVVAYRGLHRWVRAFERVAPSSAPHGEILREDGAYLITGGLGGVGLEIAAHFARAAKVRCVLLGRSALPSRDTWDAWLAGHPDDDPASQRIRRIRDIESRGATVMVVNADVADAAQLAAAVESAEARLGPIRGVIHAAGAQKAAEPLHALARAGCEAQFRPKLAGLRALERVFDGRALDFFLVHSSLASVTGVAGFVSYTASHVFMDAFVHRHNRAAASPWRTVNWDNWRGVEATPAAAAQGAEFYLTPSEAGETLDRILSRPELPQVLVSTGPLQGRIDRWLARDEAAPEAAQPAASKAHPRPALSSPYAAPRNEAERVLAGIWQETLGIDLIGVDDNFFELGGDSVLNIQITAKANRLGLRLTPRQVFENQTIAELARLAGSAAAPAVEPEAAPGPVPLTPIQAWFFERALERPDHFNLPMLLEVRRPLDAAILARALAHLVRHHDALRLRFERGAAGWSQRLAPADVSIPVEHIDLSGLGVEEQRRRIEAEGSALQKSLDLAAGRLMKLALFDLGAGESGRLLFVAHHLVVDVISWRILLEDLEQACAALAAGREPALPPRTVSFRRWSEALHAYAQTPAAEAELAFWRDLGRPGIARLPVDLAQGPNSVATLRRLDEALDEEETRALLTELPRAFGTKIDAALLYALAKVLGDWSGSRAALVDFEGHGRDAILEGIDASRTVGWFTTLSPVRIEIPAGDDAADGLRAVHRQLDAIAHHGMGFGILRYLSAKPAVREALAALPPREVSFLYTGQLDQAFGRDTLFGLAAEPAGDFHDPGGERSHLLEVNSAVMRGRLHVTWTYGANRHREATIRDLARGYMEALRSLLARARGAGAAQAAAAGVAPGPADMAEIARQVALASEPAQ